MSGQRILPPQLTPGDRVDDATRTRREAVEAARERKALAEQIQKDLTVIPDDFELEDVKTPDMSAYWELIPEVQPPGGADRFDSVYGANLALSRVFPILDTVMWLPTRVLLSLALSGRTDVVSLERFDQLVDQVRKAQRNQPPATPEAIQEEVALPTSAPTGARRMVIVLLALTIGLILVSWLYLHGSDTEIRAQVAGNATRIEAIDHRVDHIDIRTAELVTALISEKTTVVSLTSEKEALEGTLRSLEGELDKVVRDQVAEQRRKDVDVKIEIRKVSDRLQALQAELERLRLERESEKENR